MPTVTRARLRRMLGENTGFFFAGSLTTEGGASGANIVDTKITRYNTNRLAGMWHVLTSTSGSSPPVGETQRISSVSGSTITPVNVWTAVVASGVTYEIMEHDPAALDWALQEAGRVLASKIRLPIRDETLVVDNLLANWDFETYTSPSFASWANKGTTVLVTQATNRLIHGSNSAQIIGFDGDGIEQNIIAAASGGRQIDRMVDKTLHVRGWTFASAASLARLRVTFDGTTYTNGPYHRGRDEWEGPSLQYIDAPIPADLTEMTVSFEKSLGGTMYCDKVVAWIDPITRYALPSTFYPYGPHRVLQQARMDRPNGLYLPIGVGNPALPGRILRLEGEGRITIPTTETGTMELDETQAELVVAEAAVALFQRLANSEPGAAARFAANEARWKQRRDELLGSPSLQLSPMSADKRIGWKMAPADSTNTTQSLLLTHR